MKIPKAGKNQSTDKFLKSGFRVIKRKRERKMGTDGDDTQQAVNEKRF